MNLKFLILYFFEHQLRKRVTFLPIAIFFIYILSFFLDPNLRLLNTFQQVFTLFWLIFFLIFTANNLQEKISQDNLELILAKPFSKRDFLIADSLSNIFYFSLNLIVTTICSAMIGEFISFNLWDILIPFVISLCLVFLTLYSYLQLTIVITKNGALSAVMWLVYSMVVSGILESWEMFLPKFEQEPFFQSIMNILYYSLPQTFAISHMFNKEFNYMTLLIALLQFFAISVITIRIFDKQRVK